MYYVCEIGIEEIFLRREFKEPQVYELQHDPSASSHKHERAASTNTSTQPCASWQPTLISSSSASSGFKFNSTKGRAPLPPTTSPIVTTERVKAVTFSSEPTGIIESNSVHPPIAPKPQIVSNHFNVRLPTQVMPEPNQSSRLASNLSQMHMGLTPQRQTFVAPRRGNPDPMSLPSASYTRGMGVMNSRNELKATAERPKVPPPPPQPHLKNTVPNFPPKAPSDLQSQICNYNKNKLKKVPTHEQVNTASGRQNKQSVPPRTGNMSIHRDPQAEIFMQMKEKCAKIRSAIDGEEDNEEEESGAWDP